MIITEKDSGASISFHRKNLHKLFLDLKWTKPYGSILFGTIYRKNYHRKISKKVFQNIVLLSPCYYLKHTEILNFVAWHMHCFVRAVITRYHGLAGLSSRNVCSHISEGWKFKFNVSAGLVSSEASLLGLQMAVSCLCPHRAFSPFLCPWPSLVSLSLFIRTPIRLGLGLC